MPRSDFRNGARSGNLSGFSRRGIRLFCGADDPHVPALGDLERLVVTDGTVFAFIDVQEHTLINSVDDDGRIEVIDKAELALDRISNNGDCDDLVRKRAGLDRTIGEVLREVHLVAVNRDAYADRTRLESERCSARRGQPGRGQWLSAGSATPGRCELRNG